MGLIFERIRAVMLFYVTALSAYLAWELHKADGLLEELHSFVQESLNKNYYEGFLFIYFFCIIYLILRSKIR